MRNEWFISDTHFGHKNILEYEKESRKFDSIQEMNEKIINNWNNTVSIKDIVYHLGDFAFGKINIDIASRLNGKKKLILGNHDIYDFKLYAPYFENIYGAFQWEKCIITHIPIHIDCLKDRFIMNIHGHTHSAIIDDARYYNVSCEINNLIPLHADIILERINKLKNNN